MRETENYPFKKEYDDFLCITDMRGGVGYAFLTAGVALLIGCLLGAIAVFADPEIPKDALVFLLFLAIISIAIIRRIRKQMAMGMYYYTYVGRDEIVWGDMNEKTVIKIEDVTRIDMSELSIKHVRLTLKTGDVYKIKDRYLLRMEELYEKLKSFDNIEVHHEDK